MKVKSGEFVGIDEKFIKEEDKYVDPSVIMTEEKQKKMAKNMFKGVWIFIAIIFGMVILGFIVTIISIIVMSSSMFSLIPM